MLKSRSLSMVIDSTKKKKVTMMEQEIHITLRLNLAIRKVGLNEIVYRLKELRDPLVVMILEQIFMGYDNLISERLTQTKMYPSKARKGLGRHLRRIAWGWSDTAATNISKMIVIRQYSRDKWEECWKEKLGIKGHFSIQIEAVELSSSLNL